jgi:peroxidase
LFNAADEEDTDKSFTLSNYFFDASRLQETGFIDAALRGLTKQPQQRIDTFYTNEVSMNLYR